MSRTIKEPAVRRNEILDAAQRLIYTRGYEQMAIQDILDDLQIAKGTLYHYFDSKRALLEALVERTMDEVERLLLPIVQEPSLSALDRFQLIFDALYHYRNEQKPFLLELLRVWHSDDNALVQQRTRAMMEMRVEPLLAVIIRQGVEEGVFATAYPRQAGKVILSLQQGLVGTVTGLLLADEPPIPERLKQMEDAIAAYIDAVERVLGAPGGSLHPFDVELLKEWMAS